jgi:hypothetical protein
MYEPGREAEARKVAGDLSKPLGETALQEMTGDVRSAAKGAGVALVVGQDDSQV